MCAPCSHYARAYASSSGSSCARAWHVMAKKPFAQSSFPSIDRLTSIEIERMGVSIVLLLLLVLTPSGGRAEGDKKYFPIYTNSFHSSLITECRIDGKNSDLPSFGTLSRSSLGAFCLCNHWKHKRGHLQLDLALWKSRSSFGNKYILESQQGGPV